MNELLAGSSRRPSRVRGRMILLTLSVAVPFLALLIFEQGRVIDSQRALIQQLVSDSMELNSLKAHKAQNPAGSTQIAPQAPESRPTQPETTQPSVAPKAGKRKSAPTQQAPVAPKAPARVIDMTHLKAV